MHDKYGSVSICSSCSFVAMARQVLCLVTAIDDGLLFPRCC